MQFKNKLINVVGRIIAICMGMATLSSCDSMIYDDEGDCDPPLQSEVHIRYEHEVL